MTENKQPESTQLNQTHGFSISPQDEISFLEILDVLISKKILILSITSVFVLVSISYSILATPTYRTKIGFLPPQALIESQLNANFLTIDNKNSLYKKFLTQLQSYNSQKKVFESGNFLNRFSDNSRKSANPNDVLLKLHNSVTLEKGFTAKEQKKKQKELFEKPSYLEIEGSKPKAMSDFLNALTEASIKNIRQEAKDLAKRELNDQLIKAEKDRLNLILSLKITLDRLRAEAKFDQINLISFLTEQLGIARKLKIKHNNFRFAESIYPIQSLPSLKIQNQPIWFMYGESAILEEINLLNSRTNNDPFIPKTGEILAQLKALNINAKSGINGDRDIPETNTILAQLKALSANPTLEPKKPHKQLQDKDIAKVVGMLNRLKAVDISRINPKIVIIDQPSIPPTDPIEPNKKAIVAIGTLLGLLIGLLATFLGYAIETLRKKKELSSPT